MAARGIGGARVLLPRSEIATAELPERLRSEGAVVEEVSAYRNSIPDDSREAAKEAIRRGVDAITFASSSSVTNLLSLLDDDVSALSGAAIACIGPATAATAGRRGLKVDIVAEQATIDSLADSLIERFSSE